jgi:hypothetical protein
MNRMHFHRTNAAASHGVFLLRAAQINEKTDGAERGKPAVKETNEEHEISKQVGGSCTCTCTGDHYMPLRKH